MAKEIKKWTTLESRYIIERPWLTARVDKVQLPDGRINPEHYRHGFDQVLVELCAGVVEQGEAPIEAARRELLEETGYAGGEWREVMTIGQNPSISNNITHCFVAEGVEKVSHQSLDESEDIEVLLMSKEEVLQMLLRDEQKQALMAAPLWRYFWEQKDIIETTR